MVRGGHRKERAYLDVDWRFRSDLKPLEVIAAGLHSLRLACMRCRNRKSGKPCLAGGVSGKG